MTSRFLLGSQRSNPTAAANNTPVSPRENVTASNPIPIASSNNSQGAQLQQSQNAQASPSSPSKQFQTSTAPNQSTPPKRGFQLGSYRPPGEGVWNADEENKLKELSERQAEVERKLQEIALKQQQLKSGASSGDNSARSSTAETSTEPRTPPPSRTSEASSTTSSAVDSPRSAVTPRGQVPNLSWQNSPRATNTPSSGNTSNPTSPRQMAPKQVADDEVSAMSGRVANPPVPVVSSNPAASNSGNNSPINWRKSSASSGGSSNVVSTTRAVSPTRAVATNPAPTNSLSNSGSFRSAVPRLSLSRSRLPVQTRLSFSRSNVSTSTDMHGTTSSTAADPTATPADPAFDDLLADLERPIHEGVITSNAIQLAKDLDVQALIPDSVFIMERKCLLLTLQVRMLLREMTEYKLKSERMKNGNLSIEEMQNIISLSPDQTDDKAWILEIGELKRMIIQENRKNYLLEQELKKLEKKISLLIANRTSIQELDRQERKAKTKAVLDSPRSKIDLLAPKRVEIYSHLFYLLQTDPGYLANLTFLVQSDSVTKFLDTILLSLFGHSFAPREEYLLLKLFYLAVLKEIKHLKSDINELTQTDSIIPKMLITYNKRKQGVEFLKGTLGIYLKKFLTEDYEFELKPLAVYHALAKQQGKTNTDISVEELSSNNEVQDILRQRVAQLTKVCDDILKIAIDNVNSVPYGLRLICKQIMSSAQARFPKAAQQDILKVIGYYVFYRFMNLIIVTPEAFDIEAPPAGKRKNLITVSIVLQRLFNLDLFPSKNVMTPLNDWITKNIPNVEDYFKTLMDVTDPEEYLQVNKYMDLYSTEKPFVIISLEEITEIHSLLYRHLGQLAPEPNDPLRIIMADLGDVPTMTESQKETEVQLTLENRFKDVTKNILDDDSNINVKYEQTVDYVVKILGAIVKMGKRQHTLMEVLQAAREYASGSNDKILQSLVTKTEENLKILAEHNKVDPEKNYSEFLRDVAFKVVNRTNRREQQLKELERLRLAYKNIMKYQGYLNNQLMEYQKYLISCRQNVYRNSKHRKKMVQKFHFKDLVKRGVIEMGESEMNASEKKINLFIKMLDPIENGTFDIEAKLAGLVVAKLKLELDDLLDKKETGVTSYEMDNFTLNVPETLFLLNKYFLS